MDPLKSEIKFLKGVGEHRARRLNKLNIFTIGDILEHFPRDYINRTESKKITDLDFNKVCSLVGRITSIEKRSYSRNKAQLNVTITDGEDFILCTWFRFGKWFTDQFEEGKQIWISGVVTEFRSAPQIIHPEIEVLDDEDSEISFWHARNILPVYPLTEGITINTMRKLIYIAFESYSNNITETLPELILEKYNFPPRKISLQKIHFTQNPQEIPKLKIRYAFEELFYTQLMLARSKKKHHQKKNGFRFELQKTYTSKLKESLPFTLTSAQKKIIREIVKDMNSNRQMNRLLQGDVGSGKTIVTVFAMLLALENGYQSVLMAPTEILADQHFKSITKLLHNQPEIKITLLKGGNYKGKKDILKNISEGNVSIIIGTHALIQKDVKYYKVGLIAIDEQHRFGVKQRAILSLKNHYPDMMYLSATPIPRSLALTVYGDLDISVIDEMPPGRKTIRTYWHNSNKLSIIFEKVKPEIIKGRQVYVVCPLIEESEKIDLTDATSLYEKISQKIYPRFKIALLHGRMKPTEKDLIMDDFKNKKYDVLVSTTVIEVGIDVPNATVMIIEHAERFGLSQLHQLRGRVGRGADESSCYLIVHPPVGEDGRERLNMMVQTNDGFLIAEKDLEIRGPGDFFGTIQSGMPGFKHANIVRDQELLKQARVIAFSIIEEDYELLQNKTLNKIYFQNFSEREKLFEF